jgi:hypothetical protein
MSTGIYIALIFIVACLLCFEYLNRVRTEHDATRIQEEVCE